MPRADWDKDKMTVDSPTLLIYTTFPSEADARRVGERLVASQLAACVNIFPGMVSIYAWQGAIEHGQETAMIIKTRAALRDRVFEAVRELHPYSVPALVAIRPEHVGTAYEAWLLEQTSAS